MLTKPTLSLRGTSSDELIDQHREVYDHLIAALRALDTAAPNARDYSPADFLAAVAEHDGRVKRVREVATEVCALIEWVDTEAERRQQRA